MTDPQRQPEQAPAAQRPNEPQRLPEPYRARTPSLPEPGPQPDRDPQPDTQQPAPQPPYTQQPASQPYMQQSSPQPYSQQSSPQPSSPQQPAPQSHPPQSYPPPSYGPGRPAAYGSGPERKAQPHPQSQANAHYLPPQYPGPLPPERPSGAASGRTTDSFSLRTDDESPQPSEAEGRGAEGRGAAGRRGARRARSPIVPPGLVPAALTAALAVLLAVTATAGRPALAVAVALLQAVTAAGWFRLNGMWPARQGIVLAFAGGLTADVVLLAAAAEYAPTAIIATLGIWSLLVATLQLQGDRDPDERLSALTAAVAATAMTVIAAGLLAASPDAVTVGAAAVAVAVLARALPLPALVASPAALLAATGAGVVLTRLADMSELGRFGFSGALLGLAAGVCALIGHRVASYDFPSRFVHMTAGVALPLTAAAPAVYVLGKVLS